MNETSTGSTISHSWWYLWYITTMQHPRTHTTTIITFYLRTSITQDSLPLRNQLSIRGAAAYIHTYMRGTHRYVYMKNAWAFLKIKWNLSVEPTWLHNNLGRNRTERFGQGWEKYKISGWSNYYYCFFNNQANQIIIIVIKALSYPCWSQLHKFCLGWSNDPNP